jgi:DNA-binding CsgD family transcriptional regulator
VLESPRRRRLDAGAGRPQSGTIAVLRLAQSVAGELRYSTDTGGDSVREFVLTSADSPAHSTEGTPGWIGRLGCGDFLSRLLESLQDVARPDFVSLFAIPRAGQPVPAGACSRISPDSSQGAVRSYLSGLYRHDGNVQRIQTLGKRPTARYQCRDDIDDHAYRTGCYERPGITDRLSLLWPLDAQYGVSLSFYRSTIRGRFCEEDLARILDLAPTLRVAANRHLDLILNDVQHFEFVLARLRSRFPTLSGREAEALAASITGVNATQLATRLGVKITTVITHRKRAYERVGVANHEHLLRLYLTH